ncbi:MAG: hypothetical protein K8T20_12255 [Planctomycetes bacterium]|nr:hypothetical protein [Planctomycetota bacterium]
MPELTRDEFLRTLAHQQGLPPELFGVAAVSASQGNAGALQPNTQAILTGSEQTAGGAPANAGFLQSMAPPIPPSIVPLLPRDVPLKGLARPMGVAARGPTLCFDMNSTGYGANADLVQDSGDELQRHAEHFGGQKVRIDCPWIGEYSFWSNNIPPNGPMNLLPPWFELRLRLWTCKFHLYVVSHLPKGGPPSLATVDTGEPNRVPSPQGSEMFWWPWHPDKEIFSNKRSRYALFIVFYLPLCNTYSSAQITRTSRTYEFWDAGGTFKTGPDAWTIDGELPYGATAAAGKPAGGSISIDYPNVNEATAQSKVADLRKNHDLPIPNVPSKVKSITEFREFETFLYCNGKQYDFWRWCETIVLNYDAAENFVAPPIVTMDGCTPSATAPANGKQMVADLQAAIAASKVAAHKGFDVQTGK